MDSKQEYREAAVFWEQVDAGEKKMPPEDIRKDLEQYLGSHRLCVLATACRSFTRATVLEYTCRDGVFWIFSEGGRKFREKGYGVRQHLTSKQR